MTKKEIERRLNNLEERVNGIVDMLQIKELPSGYCNIYTDQVENYDRVDSESKLINALFDYLGIEMIEEPAKESTIIIRKKQ